MPIKEDFKNLNAMVKNMSDELRVLSDTVDMNISVVYGLDLGIKNELKKISIDDIPNLSDDQITSILKHGFSGKGVNENRDSLVKLHMDNEEYKDKDFSEYVKYVFTEIKNGLNDVNELETQKTKIEKEVNDATDNYFNYINSSEYKAKKRARIEEMKAKAEEESDEKTKREITKMLTVMDKSETLEFLTERLDEIGGKEIDSIVDSFFTERKSELIMNKFAAKLPRYGYNKDVYKMFFNLEEKFLPDEYHKFNNLFLFHVMRHISYSDPNNKFDSLYVSSLLIKLYNLVYHRYENDEQEKEMIAIIKKIDDYFNLYADLFTEKNTTSPDHPIRIQRDKDYEEKRRLMLIASLQNEGIVVDTTLETDELKKILEDIMAKKQAESLEETTTSEEILEEMKEVESEVSEEDNMDLDDIEETEIESVQSESDNTDIVQVDINGGDDITINDIMNAIEKSPALADIEIEEDNIDTDELKATATSISIGNSTSSNIELDESTKSGITLNNNFEVETLINEVRKSEHLKELEAMEEEINIEALKESAITMNNTDEMKGEMDESVASSENDLNAENSFTEEFIAQRRLHEEDTPVEESVAEEAVVENKEDVEAGSKWVDMFGCSYIKMTNGTYDYRDEKNSLIEEGIAEDVVLKLVSSGALTRK